MPVTAKLSKLFYERLGEQIANELVDWFNSVDATYRADLRELNELNFARFDAKLEQRTAGLEARLEQRAAGLEAKIEQRTVELRVEFREGFAGIREQLALFEAKLERRLGEQTRWLLLAWATLLAGVVGLWLRG
jgi:hypothetical protein